MQKPLSGVATDSFLLRKTRPHWDSAAAPFVSAADLDMQAIATFRQRVTDASSQSGQILAGSNAEMMGQLQLTESGRLKRAAVLLFHATPERFIPGAFVKIGYFRNSGQPLFHDEVNGDLLTQVKKTLDLLRNKYFRVLTSGEDGAFLQPLVLPDAALREAVLDAIANKDYASGEPVRISVSANTVELWGPRQGTLSAKRPDSRPDNPGIARALLLAGMTESPSNAIESIGTACQNAGISIPGLYNEKAGRTIIFYRRNNLDGLSLETTVQKTFQLPSETPVKPAPAILRKVSVVLRKMQVKKPTRLLVENSLKTPVRILKILRSRPKTTLAEVAVEIGKSLSAIERASAKLTREDRLQFIGPRKGGQWKVLK